MVAIKNMNEVKIFPELENLFFSLTMDFIHRANVAIEAKGVFTVVLSGGSTPKLFFDALAEIKSHKRKIPWDKIKFFFGDERYVSLDNSKSNYHMAYEHLFSKVPIRAENIYQIPTVFRDPSDAAKDYELTIRTVFHLQDNEFPMFDLVYLGLGEDAHTASLMPSSDVVERYCKIPDPSENYQLVDALWVPQQKMYRITLTPLAINHAGSVVFIVIGENKAPAIWRTLEGPFEPQQNPAQLIQCLNSKTIWYLDQAAANGVSFRLRQ
ncbi:MAG TPA: 6-phosphogluconolactonase [Gammaproteobacteria bacterium]|nr:6-phosphogluconolactonase [Gammaproteobacteria bacterium]